jgi:hypothetical protein
MIKLILEIKTRLVRSKSMIAPLKRKSNSCVIHYYIHFTMQILHSFEFLVEAFRCHVHHFQCLAVPSNENDAYYTEKRPLKTQMTILHSEVNLIIYCNARLSWTKYQHDN